MISSGHKRIRQFMENAFSIVANFAGFSMEQFWRAYDFSAKRGPDGLMTQANSQYWKFSRQLFDQFHGDACFLRGAWSRRNHNRLRLPPGNFFDGNLIVAVNLELATQFTQILRQVVSERIVVVQK